MTRTTLESLSRHGRMTSFVGHHYRLLAHQSTKIGHKYTHYLCPLGSRIVSLAQHVERQLLFPLIRPVGCRAPAPFSGLKSKHRTLPSHHPLPHPKKLATRRAESTTTGPVIGATRKGKAEPNEGVEGCVDKRRGRCKRAWIVRKTRTNVFALKNRSYKTALSC